MQTIYKYPLEITDEQEIRIHKRFKPLHIGIDGKNQLCLWAMVDTKCRKKSCTIYVDGTGKTLPDVEMDYIGSAKDCLVCVWHVFIGK